MTLIMKLDKKILYGFIVICGKCSLGGIEAVIISLKKEENVQSFPYKDLHDFYFGDSELKSDQKRVNLDENVTELAVNSLEENAGYQDIEKRSPPVSFIYHKTLKKIEGKPIKVKDENGMLVDSRIRVSPLNFEPFQHLDFPLMARLSDLNLNDVGGSRARNNDEQVSMEKLKGFLKEAIEKSNRNTVKGRKSRFANLTERSDNFGQQWLSNKNELMKMLVAAYPLQVSFSQGGLLKHFIEKGIDRKFRPEEFIMGISSDPSFSSTNEAVPDENNDVVKSKHGIEQGTSGSKTNNSLERTSPYLIDDNSTSLVNDANLLTLDQNSVEQIHQSAEDTVFKNVLNQLISDIPKNVGFSTIRSVENIGFINEILKDTDRIKEIESHVKSAKQSQEESNFKESNPCMKIRVKNGPVTLTFHSQARKGSTKKPYTDPSNIPVFKINGDQLDSNKSIFIGTNSLLKNPLSGLTDELSIGEFSKDTIGKGNMSCYYTGNDLENIATSYLLEHPHNMTENKSKNREDVNEKRICENNCSKNASKFMYNPIFIPVLNDKLANYTDSTMKSKYLTKLIDYNPEENSILKENVSSIKNKIDEFYKPSGTVAVACPYGPNSVIFPNYIKGLQRFGPKKHLFLTRTGSGSYQFSHDADRLRLAAHLSRSNSDSRCKYVPKLYYNDLVVSKGLVGQHPPKDDSSSTVLSDSTLKKMEMLNILKFYLDSLSPERNYTFGRNKESFIINPMLKNNRKYFIKL